MMSHILFTFCLMYLSMVWGNIYSDTQVCLGQSRMILCGQSSTARLLGRKLSAIKFYHIKDQDQLVASWTSERGTFVVKGYAEIWTALKTVNGLLLTITPNNSDSFLGEYRCEVLGDRIEFDWITLLRYKTCLEMKNMSSDKKILNRFQGLEKKIREQNDWRVKQALENKELSANFNHFKGVAIAGLVIAIVGCVTILPLLMGGVLVVREDWKKKQQAKREAVHPPGNSESTYRDPTARIPFNPQLIELRSMDDGDDFAESTT